MPENDDVSPRIPGKPVSASQVEMAAQIRRQQRKILVHEIKRSAEEVHRLVTPELRQVSGE